MKHLVIVLCITCSLTVGIAGCTTPVLQPHDRSGQPGIVPEKTVQPSDGPSGIAEDTPAPDRFPEEDEGISLLLSAADWQRAYECGWTQKNLPATADLFLGNCQVRHLLRDGETIAGIRYDMNFIGSRCRLSTRPDAGDTCDWCIEAGPVLVIRYHGMTTEYRADMSNQHRESFQHRSSGRGRVCP